MNHRYLIALGSNQRHPRFGRPEQVLAAAVEALEAEGIMVEALGPTIRSAPIGPSLRRYANGAALATCSLEPEDLLDLLKQIERQFGRRAGGQRWSSRVLDLDIILWNGGAWSSPDLTVPHAAFRERLFVLTPALLIAGSWRDPLTGRTLRQLHCRKVRRERLRTRP